MLSFVKTSSLLLFIIGFIVPEKSLEVTCHAPIEPTDIKVIIVEGGWHIVVHNVYTKGISTPARIPEASKRYVLKASYKDSLCYSQPYLSDENLLGNEITMRFDFFIKGDTTYCKMQSATYVELNKTVALRDSNADLKELMLFYKKQE
jgi:hypothetical protein